MTPKPSSNIVVTGYRNRKAETATRDQNEKARLHRFIATAYTNWQRKMGIIPTEAESEGQP